MTIRLQLSLAATRYLAAGCLAAAASCAAAAGSTPALLEVPAGNYVAWRAPAQGGMTYQCDLSASVPATPVWMIVNAKATLGAADAAHSGNYTSPPQTWTAADGSSVTGMQVMHIPSAADQLYDQLVIANPAEGAGGVLSGVTYIQRLVQAGGGAPEAACDHNTLGTQVMSPFQATYVFWKPN